MNNLITQVLIVGAGPVGLMMANQLQRFGIDFVIIDFKPGPTQESRAHSVSPRSMEIYQQMRLSDNIIVDSAVLDGFYLYSYGHQKAKVDFVDAGVSISDFPKVFYGYEQFKTEELLTNNLSSLGQSVTWNTEFVSQLEYSDSIVSKVINSNTNQEYSIESNYIIGADGARSKVRHSKDFVFEGGEYEKKFFVADLELEWTKGFDFEDNKVIMEPSDSSFIFFFPYNGVKRYRAMGSLPLYINDKEIITEDQVKKVIFESSRFKFKINKMFWHSTYKVHHRIVDEYQKGRIILAGDAAHLHSPLGGQGMNTGLQDAHNLAWKLAMVIKKQANLNLLNSYSTERHQVALGVVKTTDTAFSYLISHNWFIKFVRQNIVFPLVGIALKLKLVQRYAFKHLSQIDVHYLKEGLTATNTVQKLQFQSGERLPLIKPGFLKLINEPKFYLVLISNSELDQAKIDLIQSKFSFEVNIIEQKIDNDWQALGVTKELFVLVRPDQHIMSIGDQLEFPQLNLLLNEYFYV
jgi:2-polyprenyl-6-methoxyphenol hydroxylase-like FAD-dependent oxidoreductase